MSDATELTGDTLTGSRRYRLTRLAPAGPGSCISHIEQHTTFEVPAGQEPPDGAVQVGAKARLHDWENVPGATTRAVEEDMKANASPVVANQEG